jgi:molecular chaperone DnaK (HSP70)
MGHKHVFGIDLGTTYSCISYIDEYGKPVVLKNSDGEHTTPSVVYMESKENIIVGNEAKRSIEVESEKTVQFIKRKMGKEKDTVEIGGTIYHAPEISAMILKKVVNDANDDLKQQGIIKDGEEIKDVVITCPAYFGLKERDATKTAGELAGLNVLSIINEPTAAAISYGISGADKEETVLVYDLGGGTFDITIMNIKGASVTVVCTGGDDQLGGKDWDEKFIEYINGKYSEEFGEDLSEDPEIMATLYLDAEVWKKSLTTREKVNVTVNGPAGRMRMEVTRDEYENITRELLIRTKNLLDDVLTVAEKKGYSINKIDKILLVGGSSRMPQVSAMLQKEYNLTPVLADPDEAVAKGAAIFAINEKAFNDFVMNEANKTGKTVEQLKDENVFTGEMDRKFSVSEASSIGGIKMNITNVLSRTYGIEAYDVYNKKCYISNMLMINDELPAKVTEEYATIKNEQKGIVIKIYESRSTAERIDIEDKRPILQSEMHFIDKVPEGTKVEVTMSLDNSGILHLIAIEQLYMSKLDATFDLANSLGESEKLAAVQRMNEAKIE